MQREYYLGKIQRDAAIEMMGELMRHFRIIREDEILVDIPDGFRETGVYDVDCEFIGEFTIRHEGSPYTWKRSFARNIPANSRTDEMVHHMQNPSNPDATFYTPQGRKVVGSMRLQKSIVLPPLSKEQEEFFAKYEKQMTKQVVVSGRRVSAQIFGIKFKIEE